MNILCLYSDWRWTGPAEPVIQMCRGLQDRGHAVTFACRAMPADIREAEESTEEKAMEYGLDVTTAFALDRYIAPRGTARDLIGLPRFLRRRDIDVLHTNLSHDQALGALCARLRGRRAPLVAKTMHRRKVPRATLGYRMSMSGPLAADGVFVFTPSFRAQYIERFGLSPERVACQPLTVDLERFHPGRAYRPMRQAFGISADDTVIGIVTRFQKYRRMDVFLGAAARVTEERPNTKFLLLGWSGQMQETVLDPVQRLGLEKNVIVAGYRTDDYVDTLACMDIFTLIMPGYDGTARAVREAMAMGIPCVVSDIGMLPEIVEHERTGLVTALTADGLIQSWKRLVDSRDERARLSRAALQHARRQFTLAHMAERVEAAYLQWNDLRSS